MDPQPPAGIRRMAVAYLRARSPQDLWIDAVLVMVVSLIFNWTAFFIDPTRQSPGAMRFFDALCSIVATMLFYSAIALFIIGCIRVIADRINPSP